MSQPLPLLSWPEITISYTAVVTNPFGHTMSVSVPVPTVYRIGVVRYSPRIVVATPNGVLWSDIPRAPQRPRGCLAALCGKKVAPYAGGYTWRKALELPDTTLGYFGLAIGAPEHGDGDNIVAVASWGRKDKDADEPTRFYWGRWEGGELVMRPAELDDTLGIIANTARATSIASCAAHPERMYAITSDADGFAAMMFRSTDSGRSWEAFVPNLVDPKELSFAVAGGNQGNDWGRACQSIAVSPYEPELVVVGWRFGGLLVSTDGAKSWRRTDESPGAHGDVHAVSFDRADPAGERIYVASDGGVMACPGLGRDVRQYETMFNRQLATLQFQTGPARMFNGGASVDRRDAGVFAGGLQDNGCVAAGLVPPDGWDEFDGGGDGFFTTFLWTGHALWNDNTEPIPNAGCVVRHGEWDSMARRFGAHTVVPVWLDDPEMPYPAGLPDPVVVSAVGVPSWRSAAGQSMYAVAGKRSSVYGFFCDSDGDRRHWEFLAHLPHNDHLTPEQVKSKNYEPWSISALGSYDGDLIVIGTVGGRIIAFDQRSHSAEEVSVPVRSNPWGDIGATVDRIVVTPDRTAFATYNTGRRMATSSFYYTNRDGYVLRIREAKADAVPMLPKQAYYGLELARVPESTMLFAATDSTVYVSRDAGPSLGDTWLSASGGLPKRPHCGDLSFTAQADGEHWLYLSTYGRSVWRAAL